ncbi:MAG TPA: LPS export ABC transporter permease LptF [Stellaceae bacterium]|nr:LPS export ABC transporter permease LptF [Stellaceae bacterium]
MNGLTRYVLRQTLMLTLAFAFVFTAAVWLVQSLRLIDLIVNRGLSLGIFLKLAVLILPRFIEIVLPIAIFLAVLFSYNRLISESELIVMRASGLSQITLARPALMLAGAGVLTLLALSTYLLPAAFREFKDLQFEVRGRFASALIQEGVFNTISDRFSVYIRTRDRRGELGGILIHDMRDPKKPVTLLAERGALVDGPDGPRVLMVNGSRQQYELETGKLAVLSFDRYTVELASNKDMSSVRPREAEELYFHELLQADTAPNLIAEMHLRLVAPLDAVVFALIPLACLLPGDFNRRGQGRRILAATIFAMLFEVLDLGTKNLASHNVTAVPLLYLETFLPIGFATWLLLRDGRWPWFARPIPAAVARGAG